MKVIILKEYRIINIGKTNENIESEFNLKK